MSFQHLFRCVLRNVKRSVPASLCVLWVVDCVSDCVNCRFFLLVVIGRVPCHTRVVF